MRQEYVALVAVLGISCCCLTVTAQDVYFPGETERPSRFPLFTTPGQRPTQFPNTERPGGRQTVTPPPTGVITQEQYNACVDACRFTSEYNPVCGTDGVTYQNIGSLNCAVRCGNPIQNLGPAPCDGYFAATTPPSDSSVTIPPTNNGQTGVITQEQYNACVEGCQFTAEYNPVCGTDGVTYQNVGSLNCAVRCGNPIQNLGLAPCEQYFAATPSN